VFYRRFAGCDDGAVGEALSEAVARLVVDRPEALGELNRLAQPDAGFGRFVLRHIDASDDPADLQIIGRHARQNCPSKARLFCRQIERAAIAAEMSPLMLRAEISARGAQAVVHRLWNIAPENSREGWAAIEQQVAAGSEEWLEIARELSAGTDAGATHGLIIALHHALPKNPERVLRLAVVAPFTIVSVCSDGDDEQPARAETIELHSILSAISRVTAPELTGSRDECRTAASQELHRVEH